MRLFVTILNFDNQFVVVLALTKNERVAVEKNNHLSTLARIKIVFVPTIIRTIVGHLL